MSEARAFSPRLDILPPSQRALWPELAATPPEFTLYGGTAIALHLGHRQSVDFDFFGSKPFEPGELLKRVPYLRDGVITQSERDTLSVRVTRGDDVYLSFFGVPELGEVRPPLVTSDTGMKVASLLDLAASKMRVIQARAEKKDYIDIDALFMNGVSPAEALTAAEIVYGIRYNRTVSHKALTYFDDANLKTLPADLKKRLIAAAKTVDPNKRTPVAHIRRYGEARSS